MPILSRLLARTFAVFLLTLCVATYAADLPDGWVASGLGSVEHLDDQTFKVVGKAGELGMLTKAIPGQGDLGLTGTIQLGPEDGGRSAFLVAGDPNIGWILAGMFTGSKKLTIQQYDKELKPLGKAWRTVEIDKDGTWKIDVSIDMAKKGITVNVEGQEQNFAGLKLPRFGITRIGYAVHGNTPATFSNIAVTGKRSG